MSRYLRTENEDGTFTNEKCYTAKDMEDFAEWASNEGWQYLWYYKCWQNNTSIYQKTTAQLREMWEDWKLAQQKGEELK